MSLVDENELTETQSWVVPSNMTSSRVCQFLSESGGSNFTETAPRPPVPGEENEIQSNGGLSTRSSESHKSNKSCKSGGSNREISTHSPAATPRRSMKDKSLIMSCVDDEDMTAPLGFEPEGSVSNSPPFTENSTPPYMKWAENLNNLLEDIDGVQLFKQFLENEDFGCYSVNFWFACEGLKKKAPDELETIKNIVRVIYKKYIKTDKLPVSEVTRHYIHEKLQKKSFASDQGVFDAAQTEVEDHMRKNTYPLFLKSDLFVQYIQKGGESPKSTSTSGSNSVRPTSGPLPTLPEDQELNNVSTCDIEGPPSASKMRHSETIVKRATNEPFTNFSYPMLPRVPLPHTYQSYAPTSLQDSEIQSISSASDALTDDTRSQTDSSIDGDPRMLKRMRKKMRIRAEQNKESNFHQPFIPRTYRQPKDRNIAETNPEAFAELLIEKLKKVEQKQENDERIRASMSRVLDESDIENPANKSMTSSFSQNNNTTSGSVLPLMTSTVIDEENADSILEEHCSRIWESSAQQTPSLSPGRHSPPNAKPKSPDKKMPSLPTRTLHHKKRPDYHSSFDSGMGEDKSVETHRHIHHHHHHHHTKESRAKIESDAQRYFVDRARTSHSANNRKHSDTGSNIDSGVSMIESIPSMPNMRDPSSEKVLTWMMESDRMGSSNTADSDKASSQKRVRSTTSSTPASRKQISKKSGHGTSRSASMDRSGMMGPSGAMPSQPFIQDPSMPLLQPPSTTVQLEEAKRRLEESRTVPPVKSKSFGGIANTKEKKTSTVSQGNIRPTRTLPCDLDMSFDTLSSEKKKKSPNNSANTSGLTGDEIVIGYYYCQEPIPYKVTVPGQNVTLAQFKHHIGRIGNYRYFFKKKSNEFESEGAVYEEIKNDNEILPLWEGRIIAKVTKND